MPFICYCTDAEGSATLRQVHVGAHLRYVETILDRILVAGPLRDEADGVVGASCLIYDTEDRDEALRLLHDDPYYRAGVWSRVDIHHIKTVAGRWVGGKRW